MLYELEWPSLTARRDWSSHRGLYHKFFSSFRGPGIYSQYRGDKGNLGHGGKLGHYQFSSNKSIKAYMHPYGKAVFVRIFCELH